MPIKHTYKRSLLQLLLAGSAVLIGACATPSVNTGSVGNDAGRAVAQLDRWVGDTLSPALATELKNKPRFEGESIAIVKLDGAELDPAIDALTERVREDLENNLINAGGVSLIWQRPDSTSENCNTLDDAGFFIGLDTQSTNNELTMRVRVLDRKDNSWVPQVSYQYRGPADVGVQQLVQRVDADTSLQGTRLSPFSSDENDLAAQRLSQQFGCTVKLSRRSATLSMQALADEDKDLDTLHKLVTNYLQRQSGIAITSDQSSADYNLKMQRLKVDSSRSQLWLQAQNVNAEVPLESVLVYVNDTLVNDTPNNAAGQTASALSQPVSLPAQNPQPVATPVAARQLIQDFRAYTPAERSLCKTGNPWAQGRVALADSAALPSGACFALRATLQQPAHIYLVHEAPDGALTRLIPDNCELQNPQLPQLRTSASDYWFPEINSGQILDLDRQTGLENFHLLAIDNDNSAIETRNALAGLPALASGCAVAEGILLRDVGAQGLRQRIAQDRVGVQWETRTLRHE